MVPDNDPDDTISEATLLANFAASPVSSTANFQVFGVHNTTRGTTSITITATAINFLGDIHSILVTDSDGAWHNSTNPADVDNDGSVTPLDVLRVINYLNNFGPGYVLNGNPPPYLDVDGDNQVTPLDALRVVNQLNNNGNGEGESSKSDTGKPLVGESKTRQTDLVDSVYTLYCNEVWCDFETNGFGRMRRNA